MSTSAVLRSESITLEGVGWQACNDLPNEPTHEAWGELSLEWVQGEMTVELGDVTPVDGSFQREITVPGGANSGRAVIRVVAPDFSTEIPVSVEDG